MSSCDAKPSEALKNSVQRRISNPLYAVKVWGRDAARFNPQAFRELGLPDGVRVFWFETDADRQAALAGIPDGEAVVRESFDHPDSILRCIVEATLAYDGREYEVSQDFGIGRTTEVAYFIFNDGYLSCDCNMSALIRESGHPGFPELDCGENIAIVAQRIVQTVVDVDALPPPANKPELAR